MVADVYKICYSPDSMFPEMSCNSLKFWKAFNSHWNQETLNLRYKGPFRSGNIKHWENWTSETLTYPLFGGAGPDCIYIPKDSNNSHQYSAWSGKIGFIKWTETGLQDEVNYTIEYIVLYIKLAGDQYTH